MSEARPTSSALERCIESLTVCHLQDEPHWPAARIVAQQDIDAFIREAGPALADQQQALTLLMAEFDRRFPDETDPVLIRSAMRRHQRRIGFESKRADEPTEETPTAPETSEPAAMPGEDDGDADAGNERP